MSLNKSNASKQSPKLPKINSSLSSSKIRSSTVSDFRPKKSTSSSMLPVVGKVPSNHLYQYNRLRSKTEIIPSSRLNSTFSNKRSLANNSRRWSSISEESSCCTRNRLTLKVPSSPQFRQVLKEITN